MCTKIFCREICYCHMCYNRRICLLLYICILHLWMPYKALPYAHVSAFQYVFTLLCIKFVSHHVLRVFTCLLVTSYFHKIVTSRSTKNLCLRMESNYIFIQNELNFVYSEQHSRISWPFVGPFKKKRK